MRNLTLLILIVLLLALNCEAVAPVQLGGDSGKVILTQVASANVINQTTKASQGDLWSWGKIPMNYALGESGKLFEQASMDEDNIWLGAVSNYIPLNTSEYE